MSAPDAGADAGHAADTRAGRDPSERTRLREFAADQAALRRVATLLARVSVADELFAAVPEQAGQLLQVSQATMICYGSDGMSTVIADTRRPARIDWTPTRVSARSPSWWLPRSPCRSTPTAGCGD
jgi:hypothetical protein